MKTKIVYTLACKDNCFYFAQAALSAYSVMRYCPNAEILLIVDSQTEKLIEKYTNLCGLFSEIKSVIVPNDLNTMQKSRYLKTKLRHIVTGDYLFVDTDTIISSDLSEIDNMDVSISAVLDCHSKISSHHDKNKIAAELGKLGQKLNDLKENYFNSGVMLVKDQPISYQLYDKWYNYWNESRLQGLNIDQPALAKANKECGYPLVEMSGIWNCQLRENFINYLCEAKILHYFASNGRSPYSLFDKKVYNEILSMDGIPDNQKSLMKHPRELFRKNHLLVYDDDVDFNRSYIYSIFRYHKWLFNIIDYICCVIIKRRITYSKR